MREDKITALSQRAGDGTAWMSISRRTDATDECNENNASVRTEGLDLRAATQKDVNKHINT